MAIISYPHTSNMVEGEPDRAVSAEFLRRFYKKDRGDGILLLGDSSACQVVATSPTSRYVNVTPGYAFIQGAYAINDEDISLQIDSADYTLNRYDTIVLRLNETVNYRNIDAYVLKGTPATIPTVPTLTRNQEIYEIGIANIYVPAASSTVQQQHIRDTRLDPQRCGESVPLQPIDTSRFFSEMEDAFARSWEFIRAALDEEMAGHLQNEIDDLAGEVSSILSRMYPVGCIYQSFDPLSPAVLFGGTWTKLNGLILRAANNTSSGGSDEITLTQAQMPSHKHTQEGLNPGAGASGESGAYPGSIYQDHHANWSVFNGRSSDPTRWFGASGGSRSFSNLPAYQNVHTWRKIEM